MGNPSFLDILSKQIRADLRDDLRDDLRKELRAELEAEIRTEVELKNGHRPPQPLPTIDIESWLLTRASKSHFPRTGSARTAYDLHPGCPTRPTFARPTAAEETRQVRVAARTPADTVALEILARSAQDDDIDPNAFSEAELKSLWRKAALNTHPDRHTYAGARTQAQMSETFAQITEAYNSLRLLFRD